MVPLRCSAQWEASSRSRRRCGTRPIATTCPELHTSTKWTGSVPISRRCSRICARNLAPIPSHSTYRSEKRATSRAFSTSSRCERYAGTTTARRCNSHRSPKRDWNSHIIGMKTLSTRCRLSQTSSQTSIWRARRSPTTHLRLKYAERALRGTSFRSSPAHRDGIWVCSLSSMQSSTICRRRTKLAP